MTKLPVVLLVQVLCISVIAIVSGNNDSLSTKAKTEDPTSAGEAAAAAILAATASVAANHPSAASCPMAFLYRHTTDSYVFAIKRQVNCLYQGLQWENGKRKDTTKVLKTFNRFAEAANAINDAMEKLGLPRVKIAHSNLTSEPLGSAKSEVGDLAVAAAAAALSSMRKPRHKRDQPPPESNDQSKEFSSQASSGPELTDRSRENVQAPSAGQTKSVTPVKAATTTVALEERKPREKKARVKLGKMLAPTAPHLNKIERLLVVGERNTGTNWLFQLLEANFNMTVLNHFCGWKHFFHNPSQCTRSERAQKNTTLAIVLWKNVFDWTLSMHRNPYHMHMHFRNSFSDFIRRPMALVDTYELSASDLSAPTIQFNHRPLAHNLSTNPKDELGRYTSGEYCDKHLLTPLQWQYDAFCPDSPGFLSDFSPPFYELNPDTQRPFANILRMRSAKIKNFRNLNTWMPNVASVRFEELLADGGQGSISWLYELSERWGLKPMHAEFQLVVANPKHPGEIFNCTEYEDRMYYSSCLRGLAAACCGAMSVEDATFVHEQLDRALEENLEYVMPSVRELCADWEPKAERKASLKAPDKPPPTKS